jgi:hypothetical protein
LPQSSITSKSNAETYYYIDIPADPKLGVVGKATFRLFVDSLNSSTNFQFSNIMVLELDENSDIGKTKIDF